MGQETKLWTKLAGVDLDRGNGSNWKEGRGDYDYDCNDNERKTEAESFTNERVFWWISTLTVLVSETI